MLPPLLVTLIAHTVLSLSAASVPVLMPTIAGADAAVLIGIFTAVVYATAAATSLCLSHLIPRLGPVRTLQLALLACTAGMLVCQIGTAPALIGGAVLVGLAYGPVTPAGSLLLTFTIPARRFGLAFSINRTGVPGGIALAGLILPRTSQAYGWHPSLAGIAAVALAAALALQAGRYLDRPIRRPPPSGRRLGRSLVANLAHVLTDRTIGPLSLASIVFLGAQNCLAAFLVVFLIGHMGMGAIEAGGLLALAQTVGIGARLVLGTASDLAPSRLMMVGVIGLVIAIAAASMALMEPGWPMPAVTAAVVLYGAASLGWNGVVLAALAQAAPRERASDIAGASTAVAYSGAVAGPALFAVVLEVAGFATAFGVVAAIAAITAMVILRRARH
ncbi:MFS transporter [Tistrella bauzanensis]|uniref:MFS transporter n=1 Tax=Tistrella arctica TaxID=3133430 RepID=A0ABU9YML1_9PROT